MKTTIIAIFTVMISVLGISASANATTITNSNAGVVLTDISKINKIEVYGNVQLYISNGPADQVNVYNRYYAESALVQSQKGVLRISSYKAEKLVVWVTVNDLASITAFDNADIRSFGKLSTIGLDVKLYNNASANLELDTYTANVTMNGRSKANLSGNVTEYNVSRTVASSINRTNLIADTTTELVSDRAKTAEYAGL